MDMGRSDIETMKRAFRLILEPGNVAELRAPGTSRGVASGYFDDYDGLARSATTLSGAVPGVYTTLNPVDPSLLSRSSNRVKAWAKHTTSDGDIVCRRWLPVDVDPQRPAGISSTNAEHDAAVQRARDIADYLASFGFPRDSLVLGDSGNGAHVLIRIELPNDADSSRIVQQCLEALDSRFGDEAVHVDITTYNAARIWKAYGTLAAKGDPTTERPHRLARILEAPDSVVIAPEACLQRLAGMAPAIAKDSEGGQRFGPFDLAGWIKKHGLQVLRSGPWRGGTRYVLEVCPWNPDHCRGEAYIVQLPGGAIAAGCHHNSCAGKGWHDLRAQFDGVPSSGGHNGDGGAGTVLERKSQATQLVELAAGAGLFHAPDGQAYATVSVGKHAETWPLNSRGFRRWLSRQFYQITGKVPSVRGLSDALGVLDGRAQYDGPETGVSTRLAQHGDAIYLDLCNAEWQSVEITPSGWKVVASSPVKFRRTRGMLPLPYPVPGGTADALRPFLNVGSDADWAQTVCWVVQALRPTGPYPVLGLTGEGGSTKSTRARVLRSLVDPNFSPLRSEPRELRDLMIAAFNSWVVAFDNLSYLPPWLSDGLCRLATGGGFSTRELYTDQEEVLLDATRPVVFTSIEALAVRGDLVDRSIILTLPPVPEERRLPERRFWRDFEIARPSILGTLLDAVAKAMGNESSVELKRLPRMADFAIWATAAESGLGLERGAFMKAYDANRAEANEVVLESSPVAMALRVLLQKGSIECTPRELLKALDRAVDEETRKTKGWPKSPKALRGHLTRLGPHLRASGITVDFWKTPGTGGRRMISIKKVVSRSVASGASVAAGTQQASKEPSPLKVGMLPPCTESDSSDGCDGSEQDLSAAIEADVYSVEAVQAAISLAIEEGDQSAAGDEWEEEL